MSLVACSPEELVNRAKRAHLLPADYVLGSTDGYPSTAEAISSALRLPEDTLYQLLALEYSLDAIPQDLIASMDVPARFRKDMQAMSAFRREGFAPVEVSVTGRVLVALCYPFAVGAEDSIESLCGNKYEVVLCTDRSLASIFTHSVEVNDEDTVIDAQAPADEGFFLGSENEEEMFPGIYGDSVSKKLESPAPDPNEMSTTATRRSKTSGNIEDLGFLDMLQMMSQSRKTGTISIQSRNLGSIFLFIRDGQVIHCITEYGKGEDGFYRIIGINEGSFEIEMGPVSVEQSIHVSTEGLMMEGLRRLDEANGGGDLNVDNMI